MIVAQITGGLGNQMFQYAGALALARHHKTQLKLDLSSFKREELPELEVPRQFELTAFDHFEYIEADLNDIAKFNTTSILGKKIQQLLPRHKRKIYTEKEFPFDPDFYRCNKNVYLKGHRQSEKYFINYRAEILKTYKLKDDLLNEVKELADLVRIENSVAVHIRRGDYQRLPIILDWHGVLNKSYYYKALTSLSNVYPDLKIYYFSDDVEWVRSELLPEFPGIVVSEDIGKNHYHDFYLIQSCKNQIVANSSFSWWAAWLNPNPDKIVIAPKKWFNNAPYDTRDLIPDSWIKI